MLSFNSLREPNTFFINGERYDGASDSYANGLFGVITVGPQNAAIQVAQAGEF